MADSTSNNENNHQSSTSTSDTMTILKNVIRHMTTKPITTLLLIIRAATLLFTFLYLVPITSFSSSNLYQKALLSNAAISALRLHERLPPFRFSRDYLAMLLMEDSAHYLFFSIIFLMNQPISLVLLPISLFAFLHSCSAFLNIINNVESNTFMKRTLESVLQNQRQILLTIALTEITLMPTILFAILAGLASILTPFLYYRFVSLRYASRRNPYSQQAFHWLRISIENFASSQNCPVFLRGYIYKLIDLVCRFSPAVQH
ncbi:Transmembrane protein 33 [Sarcoptes scabiei]|nr:Transmembrane protein 33 [Sarcoptes scabiei]